MIFKETDRTIIGETYCAASIAKDQVKELRAQQSDDHNEVLAKFDSITNSIDALADKVDALSKVNVGTADILQDLGNVMRSIRDLSKVDGEVNKKQFEAIVAGVNILINRLDCNDKKVSTTGDVSTMLVNIMEELVNLKYMYGKLEQLVVFEASATKRYARRTRGYHSNRIRAGYARRYARMFADEARAKREEYYNRLIAD